ncbi:hypothetical protein [Escherichia phage PH1062]|nr:hypothetical protein [Escherichia phage PH1062]
MYAYHAELRHGYIKISLYNNHLSILLLLIYIYVDNVDSGYVILR